MSSTGRYGRVRRSNCRKVIYRKASMRMEKATHGCNQEIFTILPIHFAISWSHVIHYCRQHLVIKKINSKTGSRRFELYVRYNLLCPYSDTPIGTCLLTRTENIEKTCNYWMLRIYYARSRTRNEYCWYNLAYSFQIGCANLDSIRKFVTPEQSTHGEIKWKPRFFGSASFSTWPGHRSCTPKTTPAG
jgi:hypothetical protein